MNHNGIFSLSFPEAKTIIVSGDIHGDFNQLVFKLCIQYQLTDTLLIVAGDCSHGDDLRSKRPRRQPQSAGADTRR